jgi:hypothetical protein
MDNVGCTTGHSSKQLSAPTLIRESMKVENSIVKCFRFGVQPNGVGEMLDSESHHFKERGVLAFSLDCPVSRVLRSVIVPELFRQPRS